MRVNFSVTNQLATPSIHASALANRPPAGQPGRLFVDTDNPSSGIYRDTGTVWLNITGGAGAGNLQTVTDAGNTTDNNILLTYPDNTLANALVFYNDALAQEEYLIEKRGTGITTNDSLAIQSRGNISPSTNPVGFLIDGANDVVRSFYTTAYTNVGLKLDFANNIYSIGTDPAGYGIGGFWFDLNNFDSLIGDGSLNSNGTVLSVYNSTQTIKTANQGNDVGLKLDFVSLYSFLGDYNSLYSGVYLLLDNDQGFARLFSGGGFVNLYADGNVTQIGDTTNFQNGTKFGVDDNNELLTASSNLLVGSSGSTSGQHLKINVGGTNYVIELKNP